MKFRTVSLVVALVMATASCGGPDQASSAATGDITDQSNELAAAQESLEESLESASTGSATGIINVLGVDYLFNSGTCFTDAENFDASGPGETADGVPFWATVSSTSGSLVVEVELGKADRFTSGEDGMADLSLLLFDAANSDQASYRIEGNRLSGSGQINDWNGVLIPFGQTAAVDFSAICG